MLGKTVLVIEDDKDSLHAVSELLSRAGYEVLTAQTGREGLHLMQVQRSLDCVVLDERLKDMTGRALLAARTRWPGAVNMPVLFVAGDDASQQSADLQLLGVVGLLRKPIEPAELLRSVAQATASRRVQVPAVVFRNEPDTAVATGAVRQARRLSDLLTRVSEVLAQGTDVGTQLRDVARAIVPVYATACVIERTDVAAELREVLCTQHESAALDADLRDWARQPDWFGRVLSEVAETSKPQFLDLQQEADLLALGVTRADIAKARALGFGSLMVVPMVARRRLFGMLTCASRASRRYGRNHQEAFADLGHRVALALDNAELLGAAQQIRRDRDELLRALSTELQAPLASLVHVVAGAQDVRYTDDRGTVETVLRETRRLEERLRELVDFAQLQAGQLHMRMQDLDLAALVRRIVDAARQMASQHVLTLQLNAEVTGLQVHGDPERLAQALQALLHAALTNTPAGGRIEASLSRVEGELHVSVSDSGACLSAQRMAALNGLVSYADDDATTPNDVQPMLALRMARALVDVHGGRFWAESRAEGGNAMHFSIPLRADTGAQRDGESVADAVILLVDSDLAFRRELQEILSERGYHVETADNGLQAWQYLLAHSPPALILFDLMLPAMDGWELHAAVKGHVVLQSVPTVVVSGLDRYRIEASLPDAQGYIEKPIRTAQLFEVVQRYASPMRPRTLSVRPSSCF